MFTFDLATNCLGFVLSGDSVNLDQIRSLRWRVPGGIPAQDVNRAFFVSFVEQAPLIVEDDPVDGLNRISAMIECLNEIARPTAAYLTVPWQALPAARRLVNLLVALSLALAADPSCAELSATDIILSEILACASVVDRLREDDLGYNHLATAIFGQCIWAAAIGDSNLAQKRQAEFLRCLEGQVGQDGFQRERSCTYHAHMLGHLTVLLADPRFGPGQEVRAAKLAARMREALGLLLHPDGGFAIFNDCADGDGPTPRSLDVAPAKSAATPQRLHEAGFVRLGADATILFDVGKGGPDETPGHAHADFLSIEMSVGSQRLIVDPGVASYKAGPDRDWTRSSHSHNAPSFPGLEPLEFFGAFRVARRGTAYEIPSPLTAPLTAAAVTTGFDRYGARTGRAVGLWPGRGCLLLDAWNDKNDRTVTVSFLIDGAWKVTQAAGDLCLTGPGGVEATLRCLGATMSISAAVHHQYGPSRPQPATRVELNANSALRAGTGFIATWIGYGETPAPTEKEAIMKIAADFRKSLRLARAIY